MKNLLNYIVEGADSVKQINNTPGIGGAFQSAHGIINYAEEPFTYAGKEQDAYEIVMLLVDKSNRRDGEGTALVNAVVELAKNNGKHAVVVNAHPISKDTSENDVIDFYTKLGFAEDGSKNALKLEL